MSVLTYATEIWTLGKRNINRLNAFQMKCYSGMLNVKGIRRSEIMKRNSDKNKT